MKIKVQDILDLVQHEGEGLLEELILEEFINILNERGVRPNIRVNRDGTIAGLSTPQARAKARAALRRRLRSTKPGFLDLPGRVKEVPMPKSIQTPINATGIKSGLSRAENEKWIRDYEKRKARERAGTGTGAKVLAFPKARQRLSDECLALLSSIAKMGSAIYFISRLVAFREQCAEMDVQGRGGFWRLIHRAAARYLGITGTGDLESLLINVQYRAGGMESPHFVKPGGYDFQPLMSYIMDSTECGGQSEELVLKTLQEMYNKDLTKHATKIVSQRNMQPYLNSQINPCPGLIDFLLGLAS